MKLDSLKFEINRMAQAVNTVIVTGFGPFRTYEINASWEVAKELTKLGLESSCINLVIAEIPVSYAAVQREIPLLWEECAPKLVIHLGLSSATREIKLETIAHRYGYNKPDNDGRCPPGGCCQGKDEVICTQIDLIKIINKIRQSQDTRVSVVVSADAGRYVCEFTYYTSLNINNHKTVFIHVPDIDKPYSVREMAECLKYLILYLLEEIRDHSEHFKTKM